VERILGIPNREASHSTEELLRRGQGDVGGGRGRARKTLCILSLVGVVAEDALKVAVAQEGSVSAVGRIQGGSWWFPRAMTLHLVYEFAPPWSLKDA
jgi:hypothetical protein